MAYASDGSDFSRLMRDLRRLVGCEALLAVTHDFATLTYLLKITRESAESVVDAAAGVLERVAEMVDEP